MSSHTEARVQKLIAEALAATSDSEVERIIAELRSGRHKLGRSLRTIQYVLKGQTGASKDRQMLLSQPHASLRSEPKWLMPEMPMEIAAQMARLVLEMRDGGRNLGAKKRRLELLAESFLRITQNGSQSDSIGSIEIGNSTPGVTLTM